MSMAGAPLPIQKLPAAIFFVQQAVFIPPFIFLYDVPKNAYK
jgi:hypothetical protein